jgi:hypothetical protein
LSKTGDPLERLNALSDEQLQYQVTHRLPFMRFVGVELADNLLNAHTVWALREAAVAMH